MGIGMGTGIVNELINKLYKQQNLEDELDDLKRDVMFLKKKLTKEELEDLSYEDFKWLWDKVGYGGVGYLFKDIYERKRLEKYPELCRAVYFPEINTLDISDEHKRRIDRALRNNINSEITETNIEYGNIKGIEIEDIKPLYELGILRKTIVFKIYGETCLVLKENELNKYLRAWELIDKGINLSYSEEAELDSLEKDGYYYIYINDEVGNFVDLNRKEDFDNYEEKYYFYKICKKPDLSWDKK